MKKLLLALWLVLMPAMAMAEPWDSGSGGGGTAEVPQSHTDFFSSGIYVCPPSSTRSDCLYISNTFDQASADNDGNRDLDFRLNLQGEGASPDEKAYFEMNMREIGTETAADINWNLRLESGDFGYQVENYTQLTPDGAYTRGKTGNVEVWEFDSQQSEAAGNSLARFSTDEAWTGVASRIMTLQNNEVDRFYVGSGGGVNAIGGYVTKAVADNTLTTVAIIGFDYNTAGTVFLDYSIFCTDVGGTHVNHSGSTIIVMTGDGEAIEDDTVLNTYHVSADSSGAGTNTIADTWAIADNGDGTFDLNLTADCSLTVTAQNVAFHLRTLRTTNITRQ